MLGQRVVGGRLRGLRKKNNVTGDIKEETRGGMDTQLAAQAEKAWAVLEKVCLPGTALPTKFTVFMRAMHPGADISKHKLMVRIMQFPEVQPARWAQPRAAITRTMIAQALVALLTRMCLMGENEFKRRVFTPTLGFDARLVTCLFVCGLIEHTDMSFQNLDLDAAEAVVRGPGGTADLDLDEAEAMLRDDIGDKFTVLAPAPTEEMLYETYTAKLFAYLVEATGTIDLHKLSLGDAAVRPGSADKIPATLFVAAGAPTGGSVCVLDSLDSTRWSDYLVRGHTITSKVELWYVFFMWLCRDDKVQVGSYGVKIGGYSCIFAYNLPRWTAKAGVGGGDAERAPTLTTYVQQPCHAYTASMRALAIDSGDVVSKLDTQGFYSIGLLYIHLLVMAGVAAGGPRRRFFTCPRAGDEALVQDALCVAGESYSGVTDRFVYLPDSPNFPFMYPDYQRTQAFDRLAVAHMALMSGGGPEKLDREIGVFESTCPVNYAWVFEYKDLTRGKTFKEEFRRQVDELLLDSDIMGVYECIYQLIKRGLTDEEKTHYKEIFEKSRYAPRHESSESSVGTSPSRPDSSGRATPGGGDGGTSSSSGKESVSDDSTVSGHVYGRGGAGAMGGAGGKSAVLLGLADVLQRLEEHAIVESAVLRGHNDDLKNHDAFATYSKLDQRRLLERLKAELDASQASLAAVIAEIKKLYGDMEAAHAETERLQAAALAEHERVVGGLQAQIEDLNTRVAAGTLRAETLQGEKEGLERELAELRSRVLQLEAENARLAAEVEEHKASHATLSGASDGDKRALTATLAEREGEIERLKLRVAELEGDLAALRLAHAATEGEHAALATANAALRAELEGAKEAHLAALLALKKEGERLAAAHARETGKWRTENKQLRLDKEREETSNVENLRSVHASLEKYLKHSTRDFTADMRTVNATTTAANKGEKGLGLLTDMLKGGRVAEFYGNVVPAETAKVEYSLPALFLICESIAGTWKTNKAGPNETVTEKLAYDCRVYDSIDQDALNQSRIKEYTSPLFQEFVAALKSAQV
jgi:hypothetical protein